MLAALLLTALAQPTPGSEPVLNPRALELFERDSELMAWAVRRFDSNRDGWLTLFEAQGAAEEFRRIADGDADGRVTPYEYGRAREFIVARY